MNNFYKWLIITTSVSATLFFTESQYKLLEDFAEQDATGICYIIWLVGLIAMVWACVVSFAQKPHMKRVKFLASLCQVLGLLGTVLGMLYSLNLNSLANIDPSDKTAIMQTMVDISSGISTCLTTTITGIIFSIMISLYPLFIKDHLEGEKC